MSQLRHIIGIMSGTSLDGIDVALVSLKGQGLDLQVSDVRHESGSLGPAAELLRSLANGKSATAAEFARAGTQLGQTCSVLTRRILEEATADLTVVHGQTIFHHPPYSLQLLDPAPIAEELNCPVLFNLRGADLAAGGQGAPITPIADWILFRGSQPHSVINLGGFCNVTHLPDLSGGVESIAAGDVCACNHLLDHAARKLLDQPFDESGEHASRGKADPDLTDQVSNLMTQHQADRSLGSGDEDLKALDPLWDCDDSTTALATLVDVLARKICHGIPPEQSKIILAGGGARNTALVKAIKKHASSDVCTSDDYGIGVQAREAVAMAVLGALAQDGIPITLPQVTRPSSPPSFDGCWCLPRTIKKPI